jgi:hypothetical protein
MMRHLNDDQLAAAMIEHDADTAGHLRECAECAAKAEGLQATLKDFGSFVHANTQRANTFWWRQRAAEPTRAVPLTRWAAVATAVIITVGVSTTLLHNVTQPAVVKGPTTIQQPVSDEALLSEVQNDVRREYADAFAPVQTNAESAVATQPASAKKKEHKTK